MADAAEYEARFRRAGLPLFIEDYSPAEDIFNRAVPLLGLVFIGELLGAANLDWSLAANLAALFGGLAILLVGIGVANRLRGRPFRSIPRTIGWPELAGFVLVPALLPLVFGGQWRSAVVTALANLLLLALILGVVGFGLLSIVRWAMARLLGQLAASLGLMTKAVPLLMIFAVVLFLTVEVWQVFTEVDGLSLAILGGLFLGLGTVFLVARLPREVTSLEREAGDEGPRLRRRQRVNVGLVLFVSQALQVLFVSVTVGAFFVAFGLLAVDAEILRSWIGSEGNVLASFDLGGREAILTEELLRVSAAIAAFTGLYFAISMLTDEVYRREFLDELTSEMRASFRERAEYLRLRGETA
jgi:hypothetical protein